MKLKKQIGFIFSCLFFVFYACSNQSEIKEELQIIKESGVVEEKDSINEPIEDKILNAIMSLPEVGKSNSYIDSISNHKKGIASIIDAPENGETDYSVRVGYNGDERFEVYYFFYVNQKTMQIKILDVITNSVMLYEDWHKMKTAEN